MKSFKNRKGSAIITAVGMGIVLLIVIAGVFSFSKYRTQTVVNESKKVKALALAEAGLEVALGELFNNSSFQTHEVIKPNNSEEELTWKDGNPITRELSLEANTSNDHNFQEDSSKSGTISGTLGDGKFKVRVGNIPYQDNPNTKAIDESKAYVFIEAMGKYDKTVRKVVAVVNRRYPAREFLMFDGGVLSLIYGQSQDKTVTENVFSIGHLYGDKGIEISKITMEGHSGSFDGTDQRLDCIGAILSGKGGIFFYSPIRAKFKTKTGVEKDFTIQPNSPFPSGSSGYDNAEAEAYGQFPESIRNTKPSIPEELKPWIKDGNDWDGIKLPQPDFAKYKEKAKEGGFNTDSFVTKYCIHKGWKDGTSGKTVDTLDVVYLDFGSNIRDAKVNKDNFPSNGYFYSDKDIVIKGNPPKDLTIVSEKNVFIAGDFNQAGDPKEPNEKYGFPQIYESGDNALKSTNYSKECMQLFERDKDIKNGDFRHHVAATVIAKERIVYDHRSPVDCFENELYPYLKYELAKAISDTDLSETEAEKVFTPGDTSINVTASSSFDGFKNKIGSFTDIFKLSNSDELANELKEVYDHTNEGKFTDKDLDDLTQKAWPIYVKDYEGGDSGLKGQPRTTKVEEQGIYQLLFKLREKMSGEKMGGKNITKQGGYLCYPEMTTNGMFVSCGKQANTFYAGPTSSKFYDEIGFANITSNYIGAWHTSTPGFVHRTFGSETNLRLYDVVKHPKDGGNNYYPPTRHKVYDYTLPFIGDYSDNPLELTGFVVLSWQDLTASEEEFEAF